MTTRTKPLADSEPERTFDMLQHIGNNGWARNSQSESLCPVYLQTLADQGVSIQDTLNEMRSRGFSGHALRQLQRWENKRVYGVFDPKPHQRRRV
ncbi:hypothetical protein EDL96_09810 [Kocuria soli]|uniref:Uncharacterized protein n=1 Tax=Kocuria soli TaxID=2485125 RepID=A0A3N3ZQG7_9MICC|nr:hypothetical protein [Kocuria soli]ROZ62475.1 hypothetical protein EDL96_09810 [Kocuria soli]